MAKYIGITIGPIYDTISMTSSPSGMWSASFLFSRLSCMICLRLNKNGLEVVLPYFDEVKSDDELGHDDGIGLFPDHIIANVGTSGWEADTPELIRLIEDVKDEISKIFGIGDLIWMREYLQVHAVSFESESSPITDSSGFLALSEFERSFPVLEKPIQNSVSGIKNLKNPLERFFEYEPENKNESNNISKNVSVKAAKKRLRLAQWPLSKEDSQKNPIRDLELIAGLDKRFEERTKEKDALKKYSYYMIVQADGDYMGRLIEACEKGDDKKYSIEKFSKSCWQFTKKAARKIQKRGGVVIYAGGDDLLFIAPLDSSEKTDHVYTAFSLIRDLREIFDESFDWAKELDPPPSLSFGIAAHYYKYPLYEAFNIANGLLKKAKNVTPIEGAPPKKNALAFSLQKHSGQSVSLVFPNYEIGDGGISKNPCFAEFCKLLDEMLASDENEEDFLQSVMTHMRLFDELFACALSDKNAASTTIGNLFNNTFDSDIHLSGEADKNLKSQISRLKEMLILATEENCIVSYDENPRKKPSPEMVQLHAMDALLRLLKFFQEKGKEE